MAPAPRESGTVNDARPTRWAWDLAFALVLVAVFAYATVTALAFPEGAKLFPLAIAIPSLVLAVLLALISLRSRGTAGAPPASDAGGEVALAPEERTRRTAEIGAWFLGIFAAVYLLGFLVAIPISALAYLRFAARESWVTSVAVAALCWALVFGVFDRLLHVPLPAGELLRVFGLR
ncbi:MAG: tripartite tricarboxylate transporter TctB family protein [Candidatus Limnocylindria bacterium]